MATRPVDPLSHNVPIVDAQGRPTPQFIQQWAVLVSRLQELSDGTGVTPGTYGGVGQDVSITVNTQGQITAISNA